jgi:hypothetical protein
MATDYYDLLIKGDEHDLEPYLLGFAAASGLTGFFFARDAGFHLRRLRERIRHHGEVQHVMCTAESLARIRAAIHEAPPRFGFAVESERLIDDAHFRFAFETPSRAAAGVIKEALARLASGVRLVDYAPEEILDPTAKGAEQYTPVHEYVFRGRGVVEGDVAGVVATRRLLSDLDFVECDEIDVELRD